MMDRDARKMLKYISSDDNIRGGAIHLSVFYKKYGEYAGMTDQKIKACMRYLEECGYIKYLSIDTGEKIGFEVEHKGHHWKEFQRQETIKYLEEKWIDFFALLVSGAALVISILALLLRTQD